jgi:hypothetical protein
MLKYIKELLLSKFINLRLRLIKDTDRLCSYPEDILKIHHVLVMTPTDEDDSPQCRQFLASLYDIFRNVRVSTFQKNSLRREDVNWLGVPNKAYLSKLQEDQFDLIIDLNSEQDKINVYLAVLSGAGVRLHLAPGKYDPYYNLQLRYSENKSKAEKYENILNYLKNLNVKEQPLNIPQH